MNFSVHILGSGTCVPHKDRSQSGYLINLDGRFMLFDSGSGTLNRIASVGVDYKTIKNVFYTHLHVDHVTDLLPLLFARKHDPLFKEPTELNVYGPLGLIDYLKNLEAIGGSWVYSQNSSINVVELKPGMEIEIHGGKIIPYATYHQPNSLGYRIETVDGDLFSYTGDTEAGDNLLALFDNADLAISECSFRDENRKEGHFTPATLAIIAEKAAVKKLLLTHLYPEMDEIDVVSLIKRNFNGSVEVGKDFKEYIIR
ncbi:MAG: ribonuclease Z [Candidatus Marinimicrobia bacterium]|nr:ribonuclease Z [Candidatus Neomarinimicrobiota bacterium]